MMNFDIKKVKIFTTIPAENVAQVRNAICDAGAGVIGNYSYCSTAFKGIGAFKPNNNANPYIVIKNKIEFVEEEKLKVFKKYLSRQMSRIRTLYLGVRFLIQNRNQRNNNGWFVIYV